jgi:hypothetical protein
MEELSLRNAVPHADGPVTVPGGGKVSSNEIMHGVDTFHDIAPQVPVRECRRIGPLMG